MMSVIDEPLICHTICQYLKKHEVDKLRCVNRAFLEVGDHILRDVNVISTCGLYTNGDSNVYYAGSLETVIDRFVLREEYESYYLFMGKTTNKYMKTNIDHVLFGQYIGIMKNDHIEIMNPNFSDKTIYDEPWNSSWGCSVEIYLDNATKKYLIDKDISLRRSLFYEAIVVTGNNDPKIFYHSMYHKYICSKIDGGILIKATNGQTIGDFIRYAKSIESVTRITFDGRLIFQ